VIAARLIQTERYAAHGLKGVRVNAHCPVNILEQILEVEPAGAELLKTMAATAKLSARGYYRTLRVARTLADLDAATTVSRVHVAEALSYRGETMRAAQAA
jgi:magnesium chelatase family protein